MKRMRIRTLTEGAIMVALATALSYIKLFELPQGGSVCIGMLPIFVYCARWGWKNGFVTAFAYGLLQLVLDGAYAYTPWSMLLDYLLAFGILGLAGFFYKAKGGIFIGTVVGSIGRFVIHFISGVVLWGAYMPDTFSNVYVYSAVYNGSFMLVDMILCLVILAALYKPMYKYFTGADLK